MPRRVRPEQPVPGAQPAEAVVRPVQGEALGHEPAEDAQGEHARAEIVQALGAPALGAPLSAHASELAAPKAVLSSSARHPT